VGELETHSKGRFARTSGGLSGGMVAVGSRGHRHSAAHHWAGFFLLPNAHLHQDFYSLNVLPQAIRGLVGLVFLFDLYTIYQHLLIYRIRRQLVERKNSSPHK